MANDLNIKHVDWKSRAITRRGKHLRDYANKNSCPIFCPYVLDIVITNNLSFPVYLISCFVLRSDHFPGLNDTACRSSFHHPTDRSDFRRTDWVNFLTHLVDIIPFGPELHNKVAIQMCVENFSGAVLKALATSTSKRRPNDDPRTTIMSGIQDEVLPKDRLRRQ